MTNIEWTDETWNPVRGCSRVSAGCDNCYAIRQAARQDRPNGAYEGLTARRKGRLDWTGKVVTVPQKLEEPLRWRKPRRVFVNSMSDLFHPAVPREFIAEVFAVMGICRLHIFQVLTKRPQRMQKLISDESFKDQVGECGWATKRRAEILHRDDAHRPWPWGNVHLGVSVEDQATADERIPLLLQTPAAVRWVSAEPLLGPVKLRGHVLKPEQAAYCECGHGHGFTRCPNYGSVAQACHVRGCACTVFRRPKGISIDWVVTGGESGPDARSCDVAWIQSIVGQCKAADVRCFVKQLGHCPIIPAHWDDIRHLKGADPAEWPEDLRVREYPS